jgi:hypothetical protein
MLCSSGFIYLYYLLSKTDILSSKLCYLLIKTNHQWNNSDYLWNKSDYLLSKLSFSFWSFAMRVSSNISLDTASLFLLDTGGYLKCNTENNLVTASLFLLDTGGYLQCHTEKIIVFQYFCSGFLLIIGLWDQETEDKSNKLLLFFNCMCNVL